MIHLILLDPGTTDNHIKTDAFQGNLPKSRTQCFTYFYSRGRRAPLLEGVLRQEVEIAGSRPCRVRIFRIEFVPIELLERPYIALRRPNR